MNGFRSLMIKAANLARLAKGVARDIGRPDPDNIIEGARSNRIRDFCQRCSERFPYTMMVMGNHEHYHGDFSKSRDIIGDMLESARAIA